MKVQMREALILPEKSATYCTMCIHRHCAGETGSPFFFLEKGQDKCVLLYSVMYFLLQNFKVRPCVSLYEH